ncbi:MAG: cysteine--tRNA ligase, partial [Candidatus Eremiobacteraeota bacterium]|nr:cysteine--tRNA ligase [Candidatus Eremiobacteraeota bacterium]
MRLYNTRTRSVEELEPLDRQQVRMYVCGLTPSADAHLGHARSFLFFDVLRRFLIFRGMRVTFVQNVTDIDDRSIATAQAEGVSWREVVNRYFGSFKASMRRMHVLEPDVEPRATGYITPIVAMIEELIRRGFAYVAPDAVYYRVKAFPRYGALAHRNLEELMIGARIEPGEGKQDPLDFALWKFAKPGEPEWPAPWGAGRPGWHIECSAMSDALLGVPFDVHGGGLDLIFPHHENEIAQSEPLMEHPPMANFWVHGGLLEFDGRKMSKSLGNFEPLSALLDRHDAQAIRWLFLMTGYRKPMNFREDAIAGATVALGRMYDAYDALRETPPSDDDSRPAGSVKAYRERFVAALEDDMNTAGAVSVLFDLAGSARDLIAAGGASEAAAFLHEAMSVLGVSPNERTLPRRPPTVLSARSLDVAGKPFALSGPQDPE